RALRDVLDRHVLPARRRFRPVVVLAHEHGRNLPELREVERLVERPDVRGAVAEEGDADARLPAKLEGERRAHDRRQAAADDRIRAHVAALDVVEVHRAAVSVRAALELSVQLGHELVRRRALGERVAMRAMRRADDVAFLQRAADADRDGLLADRHVQESGQLSGPEALLDLLLEAPDEKAPAEKLRKKEPLRDQWERRLAPLPADWSDLYAQVTLDSTDYLEPAALLLAPTNPARLGDAATFRFRAAHHFGYGVSPEMAAR